MNPLPFNEIFVKWNDESFVILFQNVKVLGRSGGIAVRELFDHAGFLVDRIANLVLSPVREKLHAFINEYDPAWYQFYLLHHCMATEFGPLLFAFIVSFGSIYFFHQRKQFQSLRVFLFFLLRLLFSMFFSLFTCLILRLSHDFFIYFLSFHWSDVACLLVTVNMAIIINGLIH